MAGLSFAYSAANFASIFRLTGSAASFAKSAAAWSHGIACVTPSRSKLTPLNINALESAIAVVNSMGMSGSGSGERCVTDALALAIATGGVDADDDDDV